MAIGKNIDVINGAVPVGADGYSYAPLSQTVAKEDAGWNATSSNTETVTKGTPPAAYKAGNGTK
jgi:hypothetical protein